LATELGRVAVGTSTLAPSTKDRRFADPAWTQNPLLHRAVQAYLAAAGTAGQLVADAHLDWRDDTRVRLLVENLVEAAAPSNVPLLIVPPTINKYYALDLAPGRSLIEYLVQGGQQVFVVSWRNPDARFADWGLDTYVQSVLDALTAVQQIGDCDRAALLGVCSGGIIAALTAAHLATTG